MILTNEEIQEAAMVANPETDFEGFGRAIEAAVLAKVDDMLKAERERCVTAIYDATHMMHDSCIPDICVDAIRSLK